MNFSILHPDTKDPKDQPEEHPIIHYEPAPYINAGSEFLDDAIYMHEQPFISNEEHIDVGLPEDFS